MAGLWEGGIGSTRVGQEAKIGQERAIEKVPFFNI